MITLETKLSQEMLTAAHNFEQFRDRCKKYLTKHHKGYDKFTVVQHDSLIGFITEALIRQYINHRYAKDGVSAVSWEDDFDLEQIKKIVWEDSSDPVDIELVKRYFYDSYDLKITHQNKTILVDIKSALTQKVPSTRWNFMYPVVQANKQGKDCMILTYYVVQDVKRVESLKNIVIAGYISTQTIQHCTVIPKGARTRFGTVSQTDNYETELGQHYKDVDALIHELIAK